MNNIKRIRLDLGLTQEEMADKLEINICTYRNYETGKRTLTFETLIKLLKLRGTEKDLEMVELLEGLL